MRDAADGKNPAYEDPVVVPNSAPALTNGRVINEQGNPVDPDAAPDGTTATLFTYRVTYTDKDNQPPAVLQVYIDPVIRDEAGPLPVETLDNAGANAKGRWLTIVGNHTAAARPGRVLRFESGNAAGRWFYITDSWYDGPRTTVTITPGFSLLDGNNDGNPNDPVVPNDQVTVVRIEPSAAGGVHTMTPVVERPPLHGRRRVQYQTRLPSTPNHTPRSSSPDGFSSFFSSAQAAYPSRRRSRRWRCRGS